MYDEKIKYETFGNTYPFKPNYIHVNGFRMHYVDEGNKEPVLLLHGDPTWGYLWRNIIPVLSGTFRCIVPDHMGMGKSEVPSKPYPYRLTHHIANLESLILELGLKNITLVVHDWGGPVGLGYAVRHPDNIKRLVITNSWASAKWPGGPLPRLIQMIRSESGEKFVLEKNGYLERALTGTTHNPDRLSGQVMYAYRAPFPTPESRIAMLCWSRDITFTETDLSYPEMENIERGLIALKSKPILIVWGMLDPVLPGNVLQWWNNVFTNAIVRRIKSASHFLQEDAPQELASYINGFIESYS